MKNVIVRWIVLSLCLLAGCHTLMTGSPIPLWYIESLNNPVQVTEVTATGLVLSDGRLVALPMIDVVPAGSALFRKALVKGVEITPDREVIGLLDVLRICGNDPVVFKKFRINLTDLAGALHPAGIQAGLLHPDILDLFGPGSALGDVTDSTRVDGNLLGKLRRLRKEIDFVQERQRTPVSITPVTGPTELSE